jgi:hypothetical protein
LIRINYTIGRLWLTTCTSINSLMCAMKCLARIAVFTALIGGVSLTNAHADGTSVYIAGKGKYCKESAVKGYLDCFYASLDACQKRNKSADLKCVANPNSGT